LEKKEIKKWVIMKRILIVCHDNLLYGASKSLLDWVKTINKDQCPYEFMFVVPNTNGLLKDELEMIGQKVIQLIYYQPIKKFNNNSLTIKVKNLIRAILCRIFDHITICRLSKVCKEETIDLIHSNSFVISIGAELARKNNIPHVWHIREFMEEDHMMSHIYRDSYIKLLTKCSYPIFISKAIESKFQSYFPANNGKIIYNTISYDSGYIKKRTFMEDRVCNLIIVGKITKKKGQMEAIHAVETVLNKGYKVRLYICGEGPEEQIIKEYVEKRTLQNYIKLLGFRNDVGEVRKNIDIALMCSSNEAFGRVTVEAMYYENFIIGKKSSGTKEIVINEENGLLYNPEKPEELAECIIRVIENKKYAEQVISFAKEYALNKFSKSIYLDIENIYNLIINEKKNRYVSAPGTGRKH